MKNLTHSEFIDGVQRKPIVTKKTKYDYLLIHNEYVRKEIESIVYIKEMIKLEKIDAAKEAFNELSREAQLALWIAPSKGGIFTTKEREVL